MNKNKNGMSTAEKFRPVGRWKMELRKNDHYNM